MGLSTDRLAVSTVTVSKLQRVLLDREMQLRVMDAELTLARTAYNAERDKSNALEGLLRGAIEELQASQAARQAEQQPQPQGSEAPSVDPVE